MPLVTLQYDREILLYWSANYYRDYYEDLDDASDEELVFFKDIFYVVFCNILRYDMIDMIC